MFLTGFDRLGAMIKVWFMRPLEYSLLNCYVSLCISLCILRVGKIAKMSLTANGLNAFHVYTHVLHAICDGMAKSQFFVKSYLFTYSTVIFVLWYM